jgi:hypothetical protein
MVQRLGDVGTAIQEDRREPGPLVSSTRVLWSPSVATGFHRGLEVMH